MADRNSRPIPLAGSLETARLVGDKVRERAELDSTTSQDERHLSVIGAAARLGALGLLEALHEAGYLSSPIEPELIEGHLRTALDLPLLAETGE